MPTVKAPSAVSSTSIATVLTPCARRYFASTGAIWLFIGCSVMPDPCVASSEVSHSGMILARR
jgi:hypothetical protein